MAIIDAIVSMPPQSVYLFPTPQGSVPDQSQILYFQYWPQSLTDDYQPEYAEHSIPGGSHPLYQWVRGAGRTISFQAVFTSELNTNRSAGAFTGANSAVGRAASIANGLLPSSPFTVDVSAALSRIRSWMMADYGKGGEQGLIKAPQFLTLVVPGTKLSGNSDSVSVILRSAPITMEAWFPDGQIRVASVDLTFSEIVQSTSQGDSSGSSIRFRGRQEYTKAGQDYKFRGLPNRPSIGGSV